MTRIRNKTIIEKIGYFCLTEVVVLNACHHLVSDLSGLVIKLYLVVRHDTEAVDCVSPWSYKYDHGKIK